VKSASFERKLIEGRLLIGGNGSLRYWLNINKPTKKCVLHVEGRPYEVKKEVTPLKGVGESRKMAVGFLFHVFILTNRNIFVSKFA